MYFPRKSYHRRKSGEILYRRAKDLEASGDGQRGSTRGLPFRDHPICPVLVCACKAIIPTGDGVLGRVLNMLSFPHRVSLQ